MGWEDNYPDTQRKSKITPSQTISQKMKVEDISIFILWNQNYPDTEADKDPTEK